MEPENLVATPEVTEHVDVTNDLGQRQLSDPSLRVLGKIMIERLHLMINAMSDRWQDDYYKEIICRLCYAFWKYTKERREGDLKFPRWTMGPIAFHIPDHDLNHILWPDYYKLNPYYHHGKHAPILLLTNSSDEADEQSDHNE